MSGTYAFDWRIYIRLDPSLGEHRREVVAVLDALADTPEGQELITKAYANHPKTMPQAMRRAKIHIGDKHRSENATPPMAIAGPMRWYISSSPMQKSISLDFSHLARLTYKDGDRLQPVSASHVLEHELYHLADPTAAYAEQLAVKAQRERRDGDYAQGLKDDNASRPFAVLAEQQAVAYVDAMQAKYTGEPPRQRPKNLQEQPMPHPIPMPGMRCTGHALPYYEAQDVTIDGEGFRQPTIHGAVCRKAPSRN